MRLTALLEQEKAGSLEGVSALLGCPLNLFEQVGLLVPAKACAQAAQAVCGADYFSSRLMSTDCGEFCLSLAWRRSGTAVAALARTEHAPGCTSLPAPAPQVLASPQQFGRFPVEERRCVLLGLWYALNWCRELVNCFATQLTPAG